VYDVDHDQNISILDLSLISLAFGLSCLP
jgi:hypothetical protein